MSLFAKPIRAFVRDTTGATAFEAIFVVLFVSTLILPTLFLMRVSETHLEASWGQRTAARQLAVYDNCNGLDISLPFLVIEEGVQATSTVVCTNADIDLPEVDQFWPRMEEAVSADFATLVDGQKDDGEFDVHRADRLTTLNRGIVQGSAANANTRMHSPDPFGFITNAIPNTWSTFAPSTEYYRFDDETWRKGHDHAIWQELTNGNRPLFPNVFPSRSIE